MSGNDAQARFAANIRLAYATWHRLRRLVPRGEQEDLLQELLLALWRACLGFDPRRGVTFSTYADAALTNAWRGRGRLLSRSLPTTTLDAAYAMPAPDDTESAALFRAALCDAEPELTLVAAGLSQPQIACLLRTSQASVSRRIARRRRQLEEALV